MAGVLIRRWVASGWRRPICKDRGLGGDPCLAISARRRTDRYYAIADLIQGGRRFHIHKPT